MQDELLIKTDLEDILDSIDIINERFKNISSPNDFMISPFGVTQLDSITMRIQVIGETIKNIEKIRSDFLFQYKEIEWSRIIRMRDLISHHYKIINPKIIYDVCSIHLHPLEKLIKQILKNLK